MHFITEQTSKLKDLNINILMLIVFSFILIQISLPNAKAAKKKTESVKRVIVVKDYKWASGGMGRPAILAEITLENRGNHDYKDIAIEVDLYTKNDIPLGSLRSTIKEILPSKSEKTFYNVKFGIMHSELQNTVARVVGADLIEKGTPTQAKDLILVKNWEWSGGQYGTEGILKEITLDNRSSEAWKDIKIRVDFLGTKGGKLGVRGFTSRAVIHDIIPPRSVRTYKGINIGFRHPDARTVSISVMSAKPISDKELKITMAKKEGKTAKKKKKKKKSSADGDGKYTDTDAGYDSSGRKLSLSEKYKKQLQKEQGITTPPSDAGAGISETTSGDQVALSEAPGVSSQEPQSVKEVITATKEEKDTTTAQVENSDESDEEEYEYEYEEEVPLPSEDIVVEDFVWAGGGVPQTMGRISEITLRNISGIDYTNIQLKIEFFSFKQETPMFSNRATIVDVLPANSKKTFKNIKAGFLNAIPQEVRIIVLDAIPFSQY
ncbi:MAG: hypothetical protein IH964_01600 [Candidatus Dadabacteria bacterium]|nr:hypothetical protein [Candidatus Dadabacteria bacterium]